MLGERAFTYVPGNTPLHRWSSRDISMPRLGLVSKTLFFFLVEAAITRVHDYTDMSTTIAVNSTVALMAAITLGIVAGRRKAEALISELWSVAKLTILAGIPMLGAVITLSASLGFDSGYSLADAPRVFIVLAVVVSALLAVAALYMATTSLSDIIAVIPGRGRMRAFVALTLISLARAEPDLVARLTAIRELEAPSVKNRYAARMRIVVRYPKRIFYLLTTMVWQLIAVTSIPVYLSIRSERTNQKKEGS